jgi:hypothetical protein
VFHYDDGSSPADTPEANRATFTRTLSALRRPLDRLRTGGDTASRAAAKRLRSAFVSSSTKGTDTFDRQLLANSALVKATAAGCGWSRHAVAAADYHFDGVPGTLPAGEIAVHLTNHTKEHPHLLLVLRVKDGVTKPVADLAREFHLPDDQQTDFDGVAGGAFAFPSTTADGLITLRPGRYVYLCPIPVGDAPDGPDHASQGMLGELRVTG